MAMKLRKGHQRGVVVTIIASVLVVIGLATTPPLASGREASIYGKTYGEWSAEWWQWALSIPASVSPVVLEGDVDCTLGQQRPVYFLAGKAAKIPENPSELPIILTGARTCTVPQGVALFFPIVNVAAVNEPGDTLCTNPDGSGRPCTVAEKRQILDSAIIGARNFCGAAVTIDGTPPYELVTARTQSPPFKLVIGADNPFGLSETVDTEVVSDGFWVMVPPLPKGLHELTFKGSFCVPADETNPASPLVPFFSVEMKYTLTVGD